MGTFVQTYGDLVYRHMKTWCIDLFRLGVLTYAYLWGLGVQTFEDLVYLLMPTYGDLV